MIYVLQQQHEVKVSSQQLFATWTLVPMQYLRVTDSLSKAFSFIEAFSSPVDVTQGHYDSLGVVVSVVSVAPGIPRSPTRRV